MFLYTIITFSDFIIDAESKYFMGWVAITIFLSNVIANLIYVFTGQLREVIQKLKERCCKHKARIEKKEIEKKYEEKLG